MAHLFRERYVEIHEIKILAKFQGLDCSRKELSCLAVNGIIKLKVKGFACNPEHATGLLTGGAGTLFDRNEDWEKSIMDHVFTQLSNNFFAPFANVIPNGVKNIFKRSVTTICSLSRSVKISSNSFYPEIIERHKKKK